jgi:hypothetical protein
MSILNKLTEGIQSRDLQKEGDALLSKWEKTGLLEGLEGDVSRNGMARLLENQASQLLKEASSMAAGDVEGFASVAFPLVRRVFGGLLANDLVSVQPMSLPSGLIFFLDFTYQKTNLGADAGDSVYGGGVVASAITSGVSDVTEEGGGLYNLANAYSSPTGSIALTVVSDADPSSMATNANEINDGGTTANTPFAAAGTTIASLSAAQKKAIRWDPDVLSTTDTTDEIFGLQVRLQAGDMQKVNKDALGAIHLSTVASGTNEPAMGLTGGTMLRRLTHLGYRDSDGAIVANSKDDYISLYWHATTAGTIDGPGGVFLVYPQKDAFAAGTEIGSVIGQDSWGLEEPTPGTGTAGSETGKNAIPEIDIKVDSAAVTAITKKLKAKWSPELGQDLNAYHNLDAEVELTSILSEQIALEIDREILNDLIQGATAGTYYWSRSPGLFVNRVTGAEVGATAAAPDFTGTVSEWYETLIETMNDVSAQIHRKTLRGGANFIVTSPEVANILEFTAGFRASVTVDSDSGTVGAVKTGSLSKKWDVYVDPYFPRNVVLVGRKGGSFLESGYVYAPYVPLQVTPTIFGTEDFVPRKGVMTRYAKKMVRPDMYGLVIVRGLLGESGAS